MNARVVCLLALACGAVVAAQQPRDVTRPAVPAGSIAGVVLVSGETKQPARRVRVTLTDLDHASAGQTATTDDAGAFAFRGVPAGRFELKAFKNAYLRASYGAARPERPGTPILLKEGETVANLTMTIARGGVITGVVRDQRGLPAPGQNVRVLRFGYNAVTGERTLTPPSAGSSAVTDDRGEYRAFGLPPGGYLVLLAPPPAYGRAAEPIRQLTVDDVQRALDAAHAGAASGAASPPRPAPLSAPVDFAPVFHPGATDIRAAATVALGVGEERAGIDIAIQLVPTARVSGTIASPAGAIPSMLFVQLVPGPQSDLFAGAGLRGMSTQPKADGSFSFTSVTPGTYTVKASIGRGRGAAPNGPAQWAAVDVNVNGQDLDVPLTLQPGVAINGRVLFEGAQPAASELQALSFALVPPGSGGVPQSMGGGRVDGSGRFSFAGVTPDLYQFTTSWNSPAGSKWTLKASTANGRDAFEAPLRVNPGETLEWTLTFTDTPAALSGVLQETGGRPATDYYILVFSSDRRYWVPGSRRVRMTRPATDGSYAIKGLPPGDYYLAAPTDLEPGEWNDPVLLEQLVRSSAAIAVREGETTKRNFRVGG